jgi:C4-dicarboxylate transporter DctM subunit
MASPELLVLAFLVLLASIFLGAPIPFALAGSAYVYLFLARGGIVTPLIVARRMVEGAQSFPLLAIFFFVLVGEIMNEADVTRRIIDFVNIFVSRFRGGLAHVNIVTSMLFAGVSGSAVADTSAVGSLLIPAMKEEGYSDTFSGAVTASSSVIGPIIPPSIIMIIYSFAVEGVSVGQLFAAGFIPGILLGGSLIVIAFILSLRHDYGRHEVEMTQSKILQRFRDAFLALLTPVLILGGILGGIFTATEAGAIAAIYVAVLGLFVYRTISLKGFLQSIYRATILSGDILLIIAASRPLSWIIAIEKVPTMVQEMLFGFTTNVLLILLVMNLIFFVLGIIIEPTANVLIWAPVFAPVAAELGMDPIHFAIMMILNIQIGLITPPVGLTLFVASSVGDIPLEGLSRSVVPFLVAELIVLALVVLIPSITLVVPRVMGF